MNLPPYKGEERKVKESQRTFKKGLTNRRFICYNDYSKRKEYELMKDYMEKCEILAYMVENGYYLGTRTMDDYARDFTVAELWQFCQNFLGGDE